jgi:phosphatidylglycerol:prolipoprotein diacylglycerol transferase
MYVVWYGLGRAWIEGLRTDSLYIPGTAIRVSQLLAALSCLSAAAVLVYFMLKPPAKRLFVDRVAEDTTEPDEGGNEDA